MKSLVPQWPAATMHRTATDLLNTHPVVLRPLHIQETE